MSGGTSAHTPPVPVRAPRDTGRGTGTMREAEPTPSARNPAQSRALAPLPPPWAGGTSPARGWPLRDFIEFGALPGAVPSARYHCRQVLWEWHLTGLAGKAELLVS